jgi:hypothetical protein
MDQIDLDVFHKHSFKNEYYAMKGIVSLFKNNSFGSIFEMDTHKNVMIMSPENININIGDFIIIYVYRDIFQRNEKKYTQVYLYHEQPNVSGEFTMVIDIPCIKLATPLKILPKFITSEKKNQ